jgi:hypothetical protein
VGSHERSRSRSRHRLSGREREPALERARAQLPVPETSEEQRRERHPDQQRPTGVIDRAEVIERESPRSKISLLKIVGNVFSWWLFARPKSLEWGWAMGAGPRQSHVMPRIRSDLAGSRAVQRVAEAMLV